jgi:hypothetical protein
MRINLSAPVLDYEGKPITLDGEAFTFRDAFMQALNSLTTAERQNGQGAEVKSKIFTLASKMWSGNEIDLTVDQAALVKERAGEVAAALVYGRIVELLDGNPSEATD